MEDIVMVARSGFSADVGQTVEGLYRCIYRLAYLGLEAKIGGDGDAVKRVIDEEIAPIKGEITNEALNADIVEILRRLDVLLDASPRDRLRLAVPPVQAPPREKQPSRR
jgi:hypothetical protein